MRIVVYILSPRRRAGISARIVFTVAIFQKDITFRKYLLLKAYSVLNACPFLAQHLLALYVASYLKMLEKLGIRGKEKHLSVGGFLVCASLSYLNYLTLYKISNRTKISAVYTRVRASVCVVFKRINGRSAQILRGRVGRHKRHSFFKRFSICKRCVGAYRIVSALAQDLKLIIALVGQGRAVSEARVFRSYRVIHHISVRVGSYKSSSRHVCKSVGLIHVTKLYHRKFRLAVGRGHGIFHIKEIAVDSDYRVPLRIVPLKRFNYSLYVGG